MNLSYGIWASDVCDPPLPAGITMTDVAPAGITGVGAADDVGIGDGSGDGAGDGCADRAGSAADITRKAALAAQIQLARRTRELPIGLNVLRPRHLTTVRIGRPFVV